MVAPRRSVVNSVLLLMKKSIPIIVCHAVPGLLFLFFVFSMRDEYFFIIYLLMALVFLASSVVSGCWNIKRFNDVVERPSWFLFLGLTVSWLLALLVFGVLNLTPLCIDQDNGDGINGIGECTMYTVLAGGLYSVVAIMVIAIVALTGGWFIHRLFPRAGEQLAAPDGRP